ncbi:hypothetical protein ABH926_006156 [Catenulispora sp. GP43]|uniref:hypothetical protein n=1 Tax=Catenulispora sp. GP43 TaxID=3156263 RepID=UPI00351234BA
MWAYTHPASAASGDIDNSEGWRRQGRRNAFAKVLPAPMRPNLPDDDMIVQSPIPRSGKAPTVEYCLPE